MSELYGMWIEGAYNLTIKVLCLVLEVAGGSWEVVRVSLIVRIDSMSVMNLRKQSG